MRGAAGSTVVALIVVSCSTQHGAPTDAGSDRLRLDGDSMADVDSMDADCCNQFDQPCTVGQTCSCENSCFGVYRCVEGGWTLCPPGSFKQPTSGCNEQCPTFCPGCCSGSSASDCVMPTDAGSDASDAATEAQPSPYDAGTDG